MTDGHCYGDQLNFLQSLYSMAQSFDEDFDDTTEKERDAIKVIILGDSAVGKTKLMERFLLDKLFVSCPLEVLC